MQVDPQNSLPACSKKLFRSLLLKKRIWSVRRGYLVLGKLFLFETCFEMCFYDLHRDQATWDQKKNCLSKIAHKRRQECSIRTILDVISRSSPFLSILILIRKKVGLSSFEHDYHHLLHLVNI